MIFLVCFFFSYVMFKEFIDLMKSICELELIVLFYEINKFFAGIKNKFQMYIDIVEIYFS